MKSRGAESQDCRTKLTLTNNRINTMNQIQRILKTNAPIHSVAGSKYKGSPPVYADVSATHEPPRFAKVEAGIPFIRVD